MSVGLQVRFDRSIEKLKQRRVKCQVLVRFLPPVSADDGLGMNDATFVGRVPAACALRYRSVRASACWTVRCCAVHPAGEVVSK